MSTPQPLVGARVVLRPASVGDAEVLAAIVNSPGVVEWWTPRTAGQVRADLEEVDESFVVYAIEIDGEVVGLIQYEQELDPQYRSAGIDISIRSDWHRRGVATDAMTALIRHLIDDLGHHRITIDPAAHNDAAIACYSSLGFRPVGILREHERGLDGTFHDGLLMDLVATDLR